MAAVEEHTVSGQMKKKKSSELVGEKQADGSTAVEPLDLNINVVAANVNVKTEDQIEVGDRNTIQINVITNSLRLANNNLTELVKLPSVLNDIMEHARQLMWLDLSFNHFSKIEEEILQFPLLRVIYLHGNNIQHLGSVRKLKQLQYLTKLTLHGNPVEGKKNYRNYVIDVLPSLKSLDFIAITPSDHEKSDTWNRMFNWYTCTTEQVENKYM
eukprot:78274_1